MTRKSTPQQNKMSSALKALYESHNTQVAEKRTSFTLRMHRSLSWLQRAENVGDDDDLAFISLWISFNAAYA